MATQKLTRSEGNLKQKDFWKAWRLKPPHTKTSYKALVIKIVRHFNNIDKKTSGAEYELHMSKNLP